MDHSTSEMEWHQVNYDNWTESHVSSWLKSIGIKEMYITKLKEEEVTGPVLTTLRREYLSNSIGMKGGQIEHLLKKRDELINQEQRKTKNKDSSSDGKDEKKKSISVSGQEPKLSSPEPKQDKDVDGAEQLRITNSFSDNTSGVNFCDFRKFDQIEKDCRYVKHNVLPPETGIENMIVPCHEYKSLEVAHKLDSKKLKAKVANEVLRFACACMNMRSNGTIHFGIMDKVRGTHKHGEIIGIPIKNQEDFVDALDYIERCFKGSNQQNDARACIRNPRFIEVLDKETTEKTWVVEYDVVPKASIVKDKLYYVGVPNFFEKDNKVKCEEQVPYCRVGANTRRIPEDDPVNLVHFIQGLREKDQQREEAESSTIETALDFKEDQKRKLSILLTRGKKCMDDSLFYIIVTNQIQPEHLDYISFLVNMNLFCVFDFDPDSETSGLYGKCKSLKPVTPHFLKDYENVKRLENADFIKSLNLIDRVSWIFCNGRNNFPGEEVPYDEKNWTKIRKKKMKKAVSLICNDILPKNSFVVLFLLVSDVEQPVVETFHEFYAEMNGHDCLTVISESKETYKKWASLAQVSCPTSTLNEISIVDMPLSHVDATVQSIQLSKNQPTRKLPASNGGLCFLKSVEEASLDSLEIISVDQCDDTNLNIMSEEEIQQTEIYFYRGGKIDWINFWLADKHKCGGIIERDAYKEASTILDSVVHRKVKRPIESVNMYHQPGSGGSTVVRQILWRWKAKVRCAVVKPCKEVTNVCEHVVKLREHSEKDKNSCLPVLLLLEDQNPDYIDDLRRHLGNAIATKKIVSSVLCFILLICNRSNDPERMTRASPSQTVAVTHKLSDEEKPLFIEKAGQLKLHFKSDFILTFVLMTEEFEQSYIKSFVKNVLDKIDNSRPVIPLIRFVALLNWYVKDSYISVSHCEAFLGIALHVVGARYHAFVDQLGDDAKLLFIHLRERTTHVQSIRIIHPEVAKEILSQLSADLPQSVIAMKLINNEVLMNHRFDRDEYLSIIKALFIRRNKKSRGDPVDTAFSPLIEHVITEKGDVKKAVDLMKAAYIALGKDAYVAQQLARLLYMYERFEEALEWAEKAKSLAPHDTFILDTLGQVYKRWFYHLYDTLEEKEPSPEQAVEILSIALKGISAFRASEKTPKKGTVSLNSSYYGEVDVGCRLLHFLSGVDVFSNTTGYSELMKYLLTDHIPAEVRTPWQTFHQLLKGLERSLRQALECISEDLSYFQTDISEEDEELDAREPEQVYNPREWLTRKSAVYAGFFCRTPEESDEAAVSSSIDLVTPAEKLSPFQRQMQTYKLGGGNVTAILSLLYDQKPQRAGKKLEKIMGMYPENLTWKDLDQTELTNFIFCQIALNCILPGSSKLLSLQNLQGLSKRFMTKGRNMSSASALFLLSLLFWPEQTNELSATDAQILLSAIDALQRLCEQKIQHMSQRKSRIVTHFFLAKGRGINKIVHRSAIEKQIKGTLSERKLKWLGGEVWKTKEVVQQLKRVEGWTENENLYVKFGQKDKKIRIIPRYSASLPHGNEKVTFYLGFSFDGVVALDIQVME